MDFARKQLEKYGWKDGQGLGKNEDGINTAIKPKLKFDNTGVGHNPSKEFTDNWWDNVYQSALNNIEINNDTNDNVRVIHKNVNSIDMSSKNYLKEFQKRNVNLEYGSFLKTAKLTQNGTVNYNIPNILEPAKPKMQCLTDEELFAACGGHTAHKAARHGIKLNGKLSRLEKQEKMLLKKLQNVSLCDEKTDIERKMKKITKHKEKHKNNIEPTHDVVNFEDDSRSSSSSSSKKHKKKKKCKSVSFNETVTEIHQDSLATIIAKSFIKDEETVENANDGDSNGFDEGIEQDIEADSSEDFNHNSFEQAQCSKTERLSKAERKLIKKKNTATMRFLQELNDSLNENVPEIMIDGCKKISCKRKTEEETTLTWSPKRLCEFDNIWHRKRNKHMKKKNKEKARKSKKYVEKRINSITKSLDKVCKISDGNIKYAYDSVCRISDVM